MKVKVKAAAYISTVLVLVASFFSTTSCFMYIYRPETPQELLK
jgi:cyclic lactone autoinducer peptide